MNDWICPLDEIDSDIRETVRIAFENGMRPYMSCSGSLKDHDEKGAIPIAGTIELLDSEYIREIMAILIADPNYSCSIRKQGATLFYDNVIPEGLNFELEFPNVCGDEGEKLSQLFTEVVNGRRSLPEQRETIDVICDLINQFDVRSGATIGFTFNDSNVILGKENAENYSIKVRGPKELDEMIEQIESNVDDIEQRDRTCTVYGSNLITMATVLKKMVDDYPKAPSIKRGKTPKSKENSQRKNRFVDSYNERLNEARSNLESIDFRSESFSVSDLMDFFDL